MGGPHMHETLDLVELLMAFLIALLSRNRSFSVSQRGNKKIVRHAYSSHWNSHWGPAIGIWIFLTCSDWLRTLFITKTAVGPPGALWQMSKWFLSWARGLEGIAGKCVFVFSNYTSIIIQATVTGLPHFLMVFKTPINCLLLHLAFVTICWYDMSLLGFENDPLLLTV